MMRAVFFAILLLGSTASAPRQAGQPINAMCPVKPNQKSKASLTVQYKGQVIGFC